MGKYICIGNGSFKSVRQDEYVDKSGLISIINRTIGTERRYSCVTRSRRFGKTLAARMLCAYYDRSCDSCSLFQDLEIASDQSFETHLNKYPVIYVDTTNFTTQDISRLELARRMQEAVKKEALEMYPQVKTNPEQDLMDVLTDIADQTGDHFIMIIDEWDAICREASKEPEAMDKYVNLLRRLFKGSKSQDVFAAVYLTGILPIKKYRTESALNNFTEYSMVDANLMAPYFGFTKSEVEALCKKHGMDIDDMVKWYDGYQIDDEYSIFNPNSVMTALWKRKCRGYWASTGAYDSVTHYIQMNFEGLKDDIIAMLAGGRCRVDTTGFGNDMSDIRNRDDVLTVLIHLGYLAYDAGREECYIPNKEVADEMVKAVKDNKWKTVVDSLSASERLLQSTLDGDAEAVARGIDAAHDENTSILSYNDENSLACVLSIAYYYAKNDYIVHRELPTGKGFADLVLIPRKNVDKPALILELKYNKDADTAIQQIKSRQYFGKVAEYSGDMLLVGINYDKQQKTHSCQIEHWKK